MCLKGLNTCYLNEWIVASSLYLIWSLMEGMLLPLESRSVKGQWFLLEMTSGRVGEGTPFGSGR